MFIYQLAYAEPEQKKRRERGLEETATDHDPSHMPFGVKVGKSKSFDLLNIENYFAATVASVDKSMSKRDVQEFMETLTPGAQNAIYAASFVWGYENSARYLKNTMKLSEVKNAADMEEKSKAVVENMQNQANSNHETSHETNSIVWGFYNDDLKDTQAISARTETISEKDKVHDKEKEREGEQKQARLLVQMPLSAQEAVTASVVENSANPALIYCAGAQLEADHQKQAKIIEVKREELAKLESLRVEKKDVQVKDAMEIALERRNEVDDEYLKIEKELKAAVDKLDALSNDEPKALEKVAAMLPSELRANLLANEKRFRKKVALRKKLVRWLSVASGIRKGIALLPKEKLKSLLKLAPLLG